MTTATVENATTGTLGQDRTTSYGTVRIGDRFLDRDYRAEGDSVVVLAVGFTRATVQRNHSGRHVSIKIDRLLNPSRFTRVE